MKFYCLLIILFLSPYLGETFSSPSYQKSLGQGYTCTYRDLPEEIFNKGKNKVNGLGYVEIGDNNKVTIFTLYGIVEIIHPLLYKLLQSPVLERLKKINQYGVGEFVREAPLIFQLPARIGYTRYQHSLGVVALIARYCDYEGEKLLKAMIAGLCHDLSHTPFSHSLDILLVGGFLSSSYQDRTLPHFLKRRGIGRLLKDYGIKISNILPSQHSILEQELPHLCADRIEYNLYASYKEGLLTYFQIKEILAHLYFQKGKWYFEKKETGQLFATIPLWNSQYRWGGPISFMAGAWISDALVRAFEIGILDKEKIDFEWGDEEIWKTLTASQDALIKERLIRIQKPYEYFSDALSEIPPVEKNNAPFEIYIRIFSKFRGCIPMIKKKKAYKGVSLNRVDPIFDKNFNRVKNLVKKGWMLKLTDGYKHSIPIYLSHRKAKLLDSYKVLY